MTGPFRTRILTGSAPKRPRPGIPEGGVAQDQAPPLSRRGTKPYEVVHVWHERNSSGTLIPVLCFACGAVWTGHWHEAERNGETWVVAEIDSGGLIPTPTGWVACWCDVGHRVESHRGIRKASAGEIERALEADRLGSVEAEARIREHGTGPKWLEAETDAHLTRTGLAVPDPALRMDWPWGAPHASVEAPGSMTPPNPNPRPRKVRDRAPGEEFII